MNMRQAFVETLNLAKSLGMDNLTIEEHESLNYEHLVDMATKITPDFSEAKLGRWLGWCQCAVVAANIGASLEDMKAINKKCA